MGLPELRKAAYRLLRVSNFGLENKIHVVSSESGLTVAPLSPWRETEAALRISEAAQKRKLAVLRLEPDVLEEANALPANHAPLIVQVEDHERRAELVAPRT